ncbi:MFS transporter [Patescibacteria group bacterium]|nr:MAG: MFS transporter [Patescibacteria group bacterium]
MSAARTYYLFFALIHIGMGSTVTAYTPFLQGIGLSLGQIALVNAIFWTVIIAAELPTGMLADGRSRAFSLKLGGVFYALGALSYIFAHSFWTAALGESLIGIGSAFISGVGTAWIADALTREGRASELRHVYATESLIKSLLMLVGGFVGALIALWEPRLIWLPFVLTALGASWVAHRFMNGQGEPLEYVSELEAFRRALAQLRSSKALMWVVGSLIVFGAVVSFNHYWALFFLPSVGQLGLAFIWPVIFLGLIGASQYIRRLTIPVGSESRLIVLLIALSGAGLLGVAIAPGFFLAMPALIVHEIGRGFFQPLTDSFVQHRVHTSYRATFGSLQSFLGRIGFAVVPLVIWLFIAEAPNTPETIRLVWIACAAILLLGAVALWFTRPREA